jgi:hypothetical protein
MCAACWPAIAAHHRIGRKGGEGGARGGGREGRGGEEERGEGGGGAGRGRGGGCAAGGQCAARSAGYRVTLLASGAAGTRHFVLFFEHFPSAR